MGFKTSKKCNMRRSKVEYIYITYTHFYALEYDFKSATRRGGLDITGDELRAKTTKLLHLNIIYGLM